MCIATGPQVGPINAVTGSNDASVGIHIPYMVKINIFPIFYPKNMKNCIAAYGNFAEL